MERPARAFSPITILTPTDGAEVLGTLLERVKHGEKVKPLEMAHKGRNGRSAHVFLRLAPIFDSTKQVIGASIWAQDLTGNPQAASRLTQVFETIEDAAPRP
jgi:hypothetical protein